MQFKVMAKLKNRIYIFNISRKSEPNTLLKTGVVVAASKGLATNLVSVTGKKYAHQQDLEITLQRVKKKKSKVIDDLDISKPKKRQPHEKTVNLG